MGRDHFWVDRASIYRMVTRRSRGEEIAQTPTQIGAEVQCILVKPSGKEAPESGRTYLPENALLHMLTVDVDGDPVVLKQGDTVEIQYMEDSARVTKPEKYKIVGQIVKNRRGPEIASLTAEVRRDAEG